jgi:hypothetical protein
MAWKNKLLTVLSEAEQYALYGLPDFDNAQRLEYLVLTETELTLAVSRPGFHTQVYCVLQIGYFKAKHAFPSGRVIGIFRVFFVILISSRREVTHQPLSRLRQRQRHLKEDQERR